jgi:Flp pilus assembly protein TadG
VRRRREARRAGSTALEFALVGPLFLFILIGTFDLAILLFLTLTVENATWDAARHGATGWEDPPGTREAEIIAIVDRETLGLLADDDLRFETRVYPTFGDVATAEWLYDDDDDGAHDTEEGFDDVNGDGLWNGDVGVVGAGGPNDIVLYRVTAEYTLITPIVSSLIGPIRIRSSAPVQNEPF